MRRLRVVKSWIRIYHKNDFDATKIIWKCILKI